MPQEDLRAKQMLQGIWLNDAEGDVSFMAKGDTIFYPDSTSQPVRFAIYGDTVVTLGGEKYHSYTQVNPTTYKVVKSSYNDDGVAVDNVYHDNIVHVSVFNGARKVYSGDFRKQAFVRLVPADYLSQSVLSDITFTRIDASGLHYAATLCIPDSPSSFVVELLISPAGRLTMRVADN
ncbi:hypothetical protein HMPREF1146_0192 [Prevotella sp. MSX73]|nr:hypothetical protein HMPREF1146_0192 [Prevotella sp. MSX73]